MISDIYLTFNYEKLWISSKLLIFTLFIYICNNFQKIELFKENKIQKLKVCVCTLGKQENKYIREFVEHYINYDVDKIYLGDNNDIDGERFEEVISEYINNKSVEIINWRGIKGKSIYYGIMNSCYQTNYMKYDWLIFYEIDEFLYLKNYTSVKTYLGSNQFNRCESVQLNWVHMSDNNKIYYENKTLKERFQKIGKNIAENRFNKICFYKSIIRGNLKDISINHNHYLNKKLKACDGFGREAKNKGILSLRPDYKYNYIMHYYTKSVQEFIEKIKRGDLLRGNKKKIIDWAIEKFFYINKITSKKIKYIQKHLGSKYNLKKYKKRIKNDIFI